MTLGRKLGWSVCLKRNVPGSLSKGIVCSWCVSNGEGVSVLSLGNRQPGLQALSLERRQMVTRLNSAFYFNIENVFNSPFFMSLKKNKWWKRPTGNLLTKAQAAPKKADFFLFQYFSSHPAVTLRVGALVLCHGCYPAPELHSIVLIIGEAFLPPFHR